MVSRVRRDDAQHLFHASVLASQSEIRCLTHHLAEYAYFFFYAFLRTSYIKRLSARAPPGSKAPVLSTAAELSLGAAAGALSQIFTIPVSVIATRQQVGRSSRARSPLTQTDREDDDDDDSFLTVARAIIREEGVTGLWLGIKPGMVLTVNPAITYGVYERLKSVLLRARAAGGAGSKFTPGMSFLLGAFSKTLATIVRSRVPVIIE